MWAEILFNVVGSMIGAATPQIRDGLKKALDVLEKAAAKTPNPIDDSLVAALKYILLGKQGK